MFVRSLIDGTKAKVLSRGGSFVVVEVDGKKEMWSRDNVEPADHAELAMELAKELDADDLAALMERVHKSL